MIKIQLIVDRSLYVNVDRGFARAVTALERDFGVIGEQAGKLLLETLRRVADRLYQRHSTPWKPGGRSPNLFARTGDSIRALRASVRGRGTGNEFRAGLTIPFPLSVHETGARISAKRGYLAIPLPAALDDRGVPLFPSPSYWDKTFVRRGRSGSLVVYQRSGSRLVPLYVLKKSVSLPPRLGAERELDKELGYFDKKILDEIDRILTRGR